MKSNKALLRDRKLGKFLERRASSQALGGEGKVIINFEEAAFNLYNVAGKVPMRSIFKVLDEQGIKMDDPRLRNFINTLSEFAMEKSVESEEGEPVLIENLLLPKHTFTMMLKENRLILSKALRANFVLPEFRKFCSTIRSFYQECEDKDTGGKVYDHILQTASADPKAFGVAVCSTDGQRNSFGDAKSMFLNLSCSNVMTYAVARTHLNSETIHKYVGQEPSGRNPRDLALDSQNRPHNPMIDAGGIMIAGLLQKLVHPDLKYSEVFDWLFEDLKKATGGLPLRFNNAAYIALKDRADGNYAQAFYMRETKCFPSAVDLQACMELYLQCRSMEVSCETLAVVAATLANGGINPITGDTVYSPGAVTDTLSLMHSCGLKEFSGHFAFCVGMTAKSSEAGAIMVVIPNIMGFCVWAPPTDEFGVSTKGLKFCEKIVDTFPFHHFDNSKRKQKIDPCRSEVYQKSESVVAILFSAAAGDVTAMRRFFMAGMNMALADYDGRTPLHLSSAEGHAECVEFLLEICEVDPNTKDRWGQTAMDDALLFGHHAIVDLLKEFGGCSKTDLKKEEVTSVACTAQS